MSGISSNGPAQAVMSRCSCLRRGPVVLAMWIANTGVASAAGNAPGTMTSSLPIAALAGVGLGLAILLYRKQIALRAMTEHRQRLEAKLAETGTELPRFKAIVQQASEAILITDLANRILYVNPAFTRLLGYSRREILGKTPRVLRSGNSDDSTYTDLRENLQRGQSWKGIFYNRCKDGTLVELETTIAPVFDDGGHLSHYVSSASDLTHEHQLEQQLRHAQKMEALGTLAGGIAHDFNNILSAIIGYTELGLLDTEETTAVHGSLQQVMKASKRAADLVAQILTFSRRNAQERQPLLLAPIVKETLKLLRGTLPTSIEIRTSVNSDLPPILADTTQLHQVIMNLCTNASHAMREKGGVLDVNLDSVLLDDGHRAPWQREIAAGEYVCLRITDSGQGMAPEVLPRIFEPYFTTKSGGAGTGLGLSTVHGIVTLHEGTIHVESSPGKGSTFTILLPVCPDDIMMPEGMETIMPIQSKAHEQIMVVDDEEPIARMIESTLSWLGYRVDTYTSSVKALEAFTVQPQRYNCVVTDQTMPTLQGGELAKRMLAIRPDIPIILCTGYSDTLNAEAAKAIGIRRYIMKPAAGKTLAAAIQQVLNP